jgi:hypothetical protein
MRLSQVILSEEGVVGGAHRLMSADFPSGGQDMVTKKVLFQAWWFLPPITERSPPD